MKGKIFISVILSITLLALGVGVMYALIATQEAPVEASLPDEIQLTVETLLAAPVDKQVVLEGFGEVRPKRSVIIATEITGIITSVHPEFAAGGLVKKGDILYQLDPRQYEAKHQEMKAQAEQARIAIKRLETELANKNFLLQAVERNQELALAEFKRAKDLLDDAIGNQKDVDQAEQDVNDVLNQVKQLENQVAIYPIQIEEAKQGLLAHESRLQQAALELEKTQIKAPFDARITRIHVEQGQYVSPASPAVELADDTILEIPVKLDAGEVRQWLAFKPRANDTSNSWFGSAQSVPCEIIWLDGEQKLTWTGLLDRVEQYDSDTRTVTVAVKYAINPDITVSPLVAGMFCEVHLPGTILQNVIPIPRSALTIDQKLYAARGGRLITLDVTIAYSDVDTVYISDGVNPGDRIITTRLINPLENTLLQQIQTSPVVPAPETE